MRIPRVHCSAADLRDGARITLDAGATQHVLRVLRLRAGDRLAVFDGRGRECSARLAGTARAGAEVVLETCEECSRESPLRVTLFQGISRGERMDLTIQKAVELGVARIVPLHTERTVVRLDEGRAERRLEHWRGIARAAAEQCGRTRLVDVAPPCPFATGLERPAGVGLLLDPEGDARADGLPANATEIALLIGPEGGLSGAEGAQARALGFQPLRLGPRILRTETAAIAALAVLQARWGDFR